MNDNKSTRPAPTLRTMLDWHSSAACANAMCKSKDW